MLEHHLNSRITRQRLRSGPIADHVDGFADWLHRFGYKPASIDTTLAGFEYILAGAAECPSLAGRSVSPHQLRHSCAVMMLQATHDIRKVALWLGHADVRTSEIYLRLDPSEKLEAVEAVLPPALRRGQFKAPDALIASLLDPGTPSQVTGAPS